MREIVFDTETTGLDAGDDRVIEIGCVELDNRFVTGRSFHVYINAQGRKVHPEALAIHGISDADLADKPPFGEVAEAFLEFVEGAKLVAHNAGFDMGFINAELRRLGRPEIESDRVVDSLAIARRKHPLGPNSLDALCRRYGIDNSRRTRHGALLDSELLAEVYIELVGGKQAALVLETGSSRESGSRGEAAAAATLRARPRPLAPRIGDAEIAAHAALVAEIGDTAIWLRFTSE